MQMGSGFPNYTNGYVTKVGSSQWIVVAVSFAISDFWSQEGSTMVASGCINRYVTKAADRIDFPSEEYSAEDSELTEHTDCRRGRM